jgi:uncharacterized RDD family membrane protein YckC
MSAGVQQRTSAKKLNSREVVVNFSIDTVSAPFLLRCGALLIDYIVVISIPVIGLLLSRFVGFDGAQLLNSELNSAGWLFAFLIGVCDLILLPILTGQSLGKMLTGLRVVSIDGSEASFRSLALRQTVGYFLTALTAFLGFFISVFSSKGRALHDYLSQTVVIYAAKRPRK